MLAALGMLVGLAMLGLASDWFVLGAARLSSALRVPAVVVGAVVVGFGTGAPELLVTVLASTSGEAPLAAGNVIGSNLANLTLVLGVAALAAPVIVDSRTVRREAPISTLSVVLFSVCILIGLTVVTGTVLLVALVVALFVIVRFALVSRRADEVELESEVAEFEEGAKSIGWEIGRAAIGLAGTLLGAQLVVANAVSVAQSFGLSEAFIGLTIVAIGTSLPELVTAVQAARRGEDDLVVGNVLGSNLFNSLAAGGLIGVLAGDLTLDGSLRWSLLLMVVVAVALGALMMWKREIHRRHAVVLLVTYVATVPLFGGG